VKPEEIILRCYAEKQGESEWFAICVDLNIYARAASYNEARKMLAGFLKEYIKEALTDDREYADQLLHRSAPAYFWWKYYTIRARVMIAHWLNRFFHAARHFSALPFTEPVPMRPL